MGTVVKISKHSKPKDARKALYKLAEKKRRKPRKTLADYYCKMPGIYGDGLTYQKR
jgi:hypothetical protein